VEYIALIHKNADSTPTSDDWSRFFEVAARTGMFRGGSEIGVRYSLGTKAVPDTTASVGGYMRFDSDDLSQLKDLLRMHPVIEHGGSIELCEMPKS
jgi:hypothetical protein